MILCNPLPRGPFSDGVGFMGGWRITSYFGGRPNPFTGLPSYHSGMDRAAPRGTPQFAVNSGYVYQGWDNTGGGLWSGLRCDDGSYWGYGHALRFEPGRNGMHVEAGDVLAYVDSTGSSTGDHEHDAYRPPYTLSYGDPFDLLATCHTYAGESEHPVDHPQIDVPPTPQHDPRTPEEILVDITYWRQPDTTITAVGLEPFLSPLARSRAPGPDGVTTEQNAEHFVGGLFRFDFSDPDEFTLAVGPHATAIDLPAHLLGKLQALPLIAQAA